MIGVIIMTNKDAIEILKREKPIHDTRKCGIELCEAVDTAIEALEKQTPKPMDLEGDGYADGVMIYDTWICPRCGKHYELEYDDYDFCPNCGQALDWEDYDDK